MKCTSRSCISASCRPVLQRPLTPALGIAHMIRTAVISSHKAAPTPISCVTRRFACNQRPWFQKPWSLPAYQVGHVVAPCKGVGDKREAVKVGSDDGKHFSIFDQMTLHWYPRDTNIFLEKAILSDADGRGFGEGESFLHFPKIGTCWLQYRNS